MSKFLFVGEGLTDFIVLRNLLIGFFNDKNLVVNRLRPKDKEPWGWGNVLNYLSTPEFRDSFDYANYIVVQIDTDKCEEWKEDLQLNKSFELLITDVSEVLIKRMGLEFYTEKKDNILFAISVHDIECWILPFITDKQAHQSKITGCVNAVEQVANKAGFSINQKNYEDGKHYEDLSRNMKNNNEIMRKYSLNPSLKVFINSLIGTFKKPQEEKDNPIV